jgi:hypothetical protein
VGCYSLEAPGCSDPLKYTSAEVPPTPVGCLMLEAPGCSGPLEYANAEMPLAPAGCSTPEVSGYSGPLDASRAKPRLCGTALLTACSPPAKTLARPAPRAPALPRRFITLRVVLMLALHPPA